MTRVRNAVPAVLAALLAAAGPARADVSYRVFVDGRPVDAHTPSGRDRAGVPYIDVVRAVRTFDGLLTFEPDGRLRVTISGRTLDVRAGSRIGVADGVRVRLPGAPFVADGNTYVPLATVAALASATLTIDRIGHRDLLALAPLPAFTPAPPTGLPGASSDDLVPTAAAALAVTLTGTSDATGLHARVAVANRTAHPFTLVFPGGRRTTFVVSRDGAEIWNSAGAESASGNAPPTTIVIPAHASVVRTANWPGYAAAGPGRYTLRVRFPAALPIEEPPVSLEPPVPGPAN